MAVVPGRALTDQQIRALVIYIREAQERARSGVAAGSAAAAAGTRRQRAPRFRVETVADGLDTPWGIEFLPGGDAAGERASGTTACDPDGRVAAARHRSAAGVGRSRTAACMDIAVHPQLRRERLGLPRASASQAETRPGPRARGSCAARLRGDALVDQQTIFQPAPALYWKNNTHFGARLLFDDDGLPVLLDRRPRPHGRRPGPRQPVRQAASGPRRWPGAGRQSVRGPCRRGAEHLELRAPQPAGAGARARQPRSLGDRARTARRRRTEPRRESAATTDGRSSRTA